MPNQAIKKEHSKLTLINNIQAVSYILNFPEKDSLAVNNIVTKPIFNGLASWYGPGFHGRTTANGEKFNTYQLTTAHPNLAFGTLVRVTNTKNGRSVVVRINDRNPYIKNRIIDLSKAAAELLQMRTSGVTEVKLEIVEV
jgi:rare lipoprotein A